MGFKVHVVDFGGGGKATYTIPSEPVDFVVTHVRLDIRAYESVEATIERPDGTLLHTFRDVLPDPTTGEIYGMCRAPLSDLAWAGGPRVTRVTGLKNGVREVIAVYEITPLRTP